MTQALHHWILDGYNVMHALHWLQSSLSFELARERFISWVGQFQALGDKHVTIVFDDNVHREGPREIHPRVRVLYSPQGFNADGTILTLVRQTLPNLRPYLTIVTRDLMLRDALFAHKCVVISPEAFSREFDTYCSYSSQKHEALSDKKKHFYRPFEDLDQEFIE
ncbi:MAG: NYN domain-containing protein [Opitutales bacterium]